MFLFKTFKAISIKLQDQSLLKTQGILFKDFMKFDFIMFNQYLTYKRDQSPI